MGGLPLATKKIPCTLYSFLQNEGGGPVTSHTSLHLDEDLVEMAKTIGGRGILSELCNETLREFIDQNSENPALTPADKKRIAFIRTKYDRIKGEKDLIYDCWEHHVKPAWGVQIALRGMKKDLIADIREMAKEWIFEKYEKLPIDSDLDEAFKDLYKEQIVYFQTLRVISYKTQLESARAIREEEELEKLALSQLKVQEMCDMRLDTRVKKEVSHTL